jgi:hypothetical protein
VNASNVTASPGTNNSDPLDTLLYGYSATITDSLEQHAPKVTITPKRGSKKPWYDDEVHQAREERRKLENIHLSLQTPGNQTDPTPVCQSSVTTFRALRNEEVKKLIQGAPTKSCLLDPLPTWLPKEEPILGLPPTGCD